MRLVLSTHFPVFGYLMKHSLTVDILHENHWCQASESTLRLFCTTWSTTIIARHQTHNLTQSLKWCSSRHSFLNSLLTKFRLKSLEMLPSYLWPESSVEDLTSVNTFVIWILHAGICSWTTVSNRPNVTLWMKAGPFVYNLRIWGNDECCITLSTW